MSIGFTEIETILNDHLRTINGLPESIVTENERLRATNSSIASFMRTQLRPATTVFGTLGVNGTSFLNGLYVIDLFYPKDTGVTDANSDVDLLIVNFEAGDFLTDSNDNTVQIVNSYPTTSLPNLEKYYNKQVIVEWRADRVRNS